MMTRMCSALLLVACSGSPKQDASADVQNELAGSLLSSTWQVQVAAPDALDEREPLWMDYYSWSYEEAIAGLGADSTEALGRFHAEIAGMYRQAALLQAHAILETYGPEQIRETDPDGVQYLVGVAHWILGDVKTAEKQFRLPKLTSSSVAGIKKAVGAWTDAGMDPLKTSLFDLGDVGSTAMPKVRAAPHYELPEKVDDRRVGVSDPTEMILLADWHEKAALQANPAVRPLLELWSFPWETISEDKAELGVDGLFLGPWGSNADLDFVRAIERAARSSQGIDIENFVGVSAVAAALAPCVGDKVDVDCVLGAGNDLRTQLKRELAAVSGSDDGRHTMLASYAKHGLLQAGMRYAGFLGDEESESRLRRIGLDEMSNEHRGKSPLAALAKAAWDAKTRNPHHAQDLLHGQVQVVSGLKAARYSLDVLYLRVTRDVGGGQPMH